MALETSMDRSFLQRLSSLLDEHLGEEQFGVRELAREIGLSKSQLLRKIQALKGKSTSQFIREYRLNRAMELLQQGEGTVSEIAYWVGFSSPTYFSSCFHEYFGYPPGEVKYRNNGAQEAVVPSESPPASTNGKKRLVWLFTLGILLVVATSFMVYLGSQKNKEPVATINSGAHTEKEEKSIGVLPFANLSGEDQFDYISEGMTGAIIDKLTRVESFKKVVPFTTMATFKNSDKSIREIARELNVTHLLEGNLQKAGDTVRIVLRLIDGNNENYDWSEDYTSTWEAEALFEMQEEVAQNVAKIMGVRLGSQDIQSIKRQPTSSTLAMRYYHQAEFQKNRYDKNGFDLAERLYLKAIEIDPNYAEPYVGLGCIWQLRGWWGFHEEEEALANSLRYLEKAIERDPDNKWAVDYYYIMSFWYDWDFEKVEPFFIKLQKEGRLSKVPHLADYARKTNRPLLALEIFENMEPDIHIPNDPKYYASRLETLWIAGRVAECDSIINTESNLYEDSWIYNRIAAQFYIAKRDFEKAGTFVSKLKLSEDPSIFDKTTYYWLNAIMETVNGSQVTANTYIAQLEQFYYDKVPGSPGWFIANYFSVIGDYDKAINWLQKSYNQHEVEMTWLFAESLLEPVKDDPRYIELLHKVGFSKVIPSLNTRS